MTNLERLQEGGAIAQDAKLTDAELKVIEGMSDEEVETLISIRQRLDEANAEEGIDATASGEATISPQFVV